MPINLSMLVGTVLAMHSLGLGTVLAETTPTDWPTLVQKPYSELSSKSQELTQRPDTEDAWRAKRAEILQAWLKHLGPAPAPAPLDPRIESEKTSDGLRLVPLSFATEGNDRCRAYLLLPAG